MTTDRRTPAAKRKARADLAADRYEAAAWQAQTDRIHAAVLEAAGITNGDVDRYLRLFGFEDLPSARDTDYARMDAALESGDILGFVR